MLTDLAGASQNSPGSSGGGGGGGGTDAAGLKVGLLAFWNFNLPDAQNTGGDSVIEAVEDRSGNANHLTRLRTTETIARQDAISISGHAPTFDDAFLKGLATSADGSADSVANFDGSASFSVSFWHYTNNLSNNEFMIGRQDATTDLSWSVNRLSTGTFLFNLSKDGSSTSLTCNTGGSGAISADTWIHIVARYDHTTGTIGIVLNDDTANEGTATDATVIGNIFDNSATTGLRVSRGRTDPVDGYMDEIGVWNKRLTDEDIQGLYSLGSGGTGLYDA